MSDPNVPPPPGGEYPGGQPPFSPQPPPPGMPPPPPPGPPPGPPGSIPPPPPPPPGGGYQPYQPGGQPNTGADVGTAFSYGWKKFTEHLGAILIAIGVWVIAAVVLGGIGWIIRDAIIGEECRDTFIGEVCTQDTSFGVTWIAGAILQLLLMIAFIVGSYFIIRAALAITGGREVSTSEIFDMRNFVPFLLVGIVVSVITAVGYALCIIPGLIAWFLLFFAQFYAADRGTGVGESLTASYNVMKNNIGTMVLFFLASLAAYFVGALLCGIGLVVAVPVVIIASAYMYRTMNGEPVPA